MTISMDRSERQPVPTPILFMSDDPAGRGGTETGLLQKASGLGPEWRPLVMVPSSGHLHGMLTQAGVDTRVLNLYRLPRFWRVRRFFPVDAWITILVNTWRLRRLLRQERIALILTVAKQTLNVRNVTRAAHPLRIPVVWSCHDTNPKVLTYCRRGLDRKLDRIIVVSEHVKQELLRAGLDCPDKIEVVHNAIDLQDWDAQTAAIQTTLREELGVPVGRPVVGLVARLDRVKGQREFLLAADMVAQAHSDATFLLVGVIRPASRWAPFSEYYREVAALTGRPALRGRVLFAGWRTDLPRVMASIDILVQPSRRETFGRVLLEAMASRRPVIATHVGGMPEIVRHGETGLLVPPDDPHALAVAILAMLADPAKRRAMGEAGRRHVEDRFTLPNHLRRLEGIYTDVLRRRHAEWTGVTLQSSPDKAIALGHEDVLPLPATAAGAREPSNASLEASHP